MAEQNPGLNEKGEASIKDLASQLISEHIIRRSRTDKIGVQFMGTGNYGESNVTLWPTQATDEETTELS